MAWILVYLVWFFHTWYTPCRSSEGLGSLKAIDQSEFKYLNGNKVWQTNKQGYMDRQGIKDRANNRIGKDNYPVLWIKHDFCKLLQTSAKHFCTCSFEKVLHTLKIPRHFEFVPYYKELYDPVCCNGNWYGSNNYLCICRYNLQFPYLR